MAFDVDEGRRRLGGGQGAFLAKVDASSKKEIELSKDREHEQRYAAKENRQRIGLILTLGAVVWS